VKDQRDGIAVNTENGPADGGKMAPHAEKEQLEDVSKNIYGPAPAHVPEADAFVSLVEPGKGVLQINCEMHNFFAQGRKKW
jgi:hypothetical protein